MQSYNDAQGVKHHEFVLSRYAKEANDHFDRRRAELEAEGAHGFHRGKIGRNATCPCGSGRKFKKCCINRAALVGSAGSR